MRDNARDAHPHCPLCQGGANYEFFKQGCPYYRCPCGFVFLWPRPSEEELQQIYDRDGEEYWSTETMIQFAFSPTKSQREIAFLEQYTSPGRLLDVGCSTGSFVEGVLARGFAAEGIDICRPAVEIGKRRGLPLRVGDVLRDQIGEPYEIVTFWATLEHLPDPMAILRRAHDLLRPGGKLFVSVPNYGSLTQRILGTWDRYVCNEHLNYFTRQVLVNAMKCSAFAPLGQTTFGFNPLVILKDLASRGREPNACSRMARDADQTLGIKESPLGRVHRAAEKALNLFSACDAMALAAVKV